MYKTEILRTADKDWYFRVVAENGKIICHSEGYRNKIDCQKIMESLGFNLLEPMIRNIKPEGLTSIYIKKEYPPKSVMDSIAKCVKDNGLVGRLLLFFSPEGDFKQLSEDEMNGLGWYYDEDRDKDASLRIL